MAHDSIIRPRQSPSARPGAAAACSASRSPRSLG